MIETTISAKELENIIGYKQEQTYSRQLLAHQAHGFDGENMQQADKLENHPKVDISWNDLTENDIQRISMAIAQGRENYFLD